MALQTIIDINVDFYDKKYILINAKQLDKHSRFLSVTCYNHGELYSLNSGEHAAYVRYRKADDYGVFNNCDINHKGKIIVKLTEQMLAVDGICYADLVVINKGEAEVDPNTGEINEIIANASVLSTMTFCIDVSEVPVANSDIESTYEFTLLNENLEKYWADFEDVMKTSKSWAVGDSGLQSREDIEDTDNSKYYSQLSRSYAIGHTEDNIRENEDIDNSKYYSEQSSDSADSSKSYAVGGTGTRENEDNDNAEYYSRMSKSYALGGTGIESRSDEDVDNAEYYSRLAKSYTIGSFDGSTETRDNESTENAKTYMETTEGYMETTEGYMQTTDGYKSDVEGYKTEVDGYMKTTQGYMETTQSYMETSEGYMNSTRSHMDDASVSEQNAKTSETNALDSANRAQSYAVGGTGTRSNEDYDNAHYYYELTKNIVIGLDTGFIPMGTVSFVELASVEKATGYVYNISDDFVTDDTFREGQGKSYTAGTNVYYTANGYWDCFGGAASPTATVDEVKTYLEI